MLTITVRIEFRAGLNKLKNSGIQMTVIGDVTSIEESC